MSDNSLNATKAQEVFPAHAEQKEESLQILMQKIVGSERDIDLSPKQVDEVLSQRREVHKYIHEERMQEHERFKLSSKNQLHYFYVGIGATIILVIAVLFKKPEYMTQVLSAVFGFLGGLGIGKFGKDREEKER